MYISTNSNIKLIPIKDNYFFKVFHLTKLVGYLDTMNDGKLFTKRTELFRKYRGFGIIQDLLIDPRIDFKTIIINCRGKNYSTTRKLFLEEGIPDTFHFGTMLFLPLVKFYSYTDQINLFTN